jgi:hypothetical protein
VLTFKPGKAVLHSESMLFGADVGGLTDERRSAAGLHNSIVDEPSPDFIHRSREKRRGTRGD